MQKATTSNSLLERSKKLLRGFWILFATSSLLLFVAVSLTAQNALNFLVAFGILIGW